MKQIALNFLANMGSLSIRERQPSFRLKALAVMNDEELAALMHLQEKELNVLIQPLEGASETLKMDGSADLKSPSERLRAVLYVYYRQNNIQDDFDTFYKRKMNDFIEHIKSKLDERSL